MNLAEYEKEMKKLARRSPKAFTRSLNNSAYKTMQGMRNKGLDKDLKLRNKHTARGIMYKKATNLTTYAAVGSIDWYMSSLVFAETRRPKDGVVVEGQKYLAIPMLNSMKTKSGKIKKSRTVAKLIGKNPVIGRGVQRDYSRNKNSKKPFLMRTKKGKLFVVRRQRKPNFPLIYFYELVKQQKYGKIMRWEKRINDIWDPIYTKETKYQFNKIMGL